MLDQTAVADQSNAITAIPELLPMLWLEGCIAILDRAPPGGNYQKAIARQIREQEADYVLRGRVDQ